MSETKADYSQGDIARALRAAGLSADDSLFVHSNIGFFGRLADASAPDAYYLAFKDAIFSVIGEDGTLVVPTFSYSFCRGEPFSREGTRSVCGFFSEMVRLDPEARRSDDANFSVAALGRKAEYFTRDAPQHSFGPDSFFERFLKEDGKICNFNFDAGSTFIHYAERLLKVPYRFDKAFAGKSVINGNEIEKCFYHFVYDLEKPENGPDFVALDKLARKRGLVRTARLGRGAVVVISARDTLELIKSELKVNPSFLVRGPLNTG